MVKMAKPNDNYENGDTVQAGIGDLSRVEEGVTKSGFLDLPGEIRNMIYRLLIPTPASPQVIRIDYAYNWPNAGSKIDDEQQLALSLYRTCKTVNNELCSLASLEYLLSSGALIPAASLEALVDIWILPSTYGRLCKTILPAARRLRVRSDYALDSSRRLILSYRAHRVWGDEGVGNVGRTQVNKWVHSGRALLLTRAFFGPPPQSTPHETVFVRADGSQYRETTQELRNNSKTRYYPCEKTLEFSCPWKYDIFSYDHQDLLSPLLTVIGRKPLLDNAKPVHLRMRGDYYDPTQFRMFNEQMMDWIYLKLGAEGYMSRSRLALGSQQATAMVAPGSTLDDPVEYNRRGDEVFHPLPEGTNYCYSEDWTLDYDKFIKWSDEELLKMNKPPGIGLTQKNLREYNKEMYKAVKNADWVPEGLKNLHEIEDYLHGKPV